MASAETLTLAFLGSYPGRAARVLERLTGPEAAALFARVPARVGGPVMAAMLPPVAARILASLEDPDALALLTDVGAQAAVSVLRHVPEPRRTRLIDGLPTATAVASRMLLGSLEDSVGGWVDPDVIALGADTGVADALARVRRGGEAEVAQLYVVDAGQRLLGTVDLHALLRAPATLALGALMREADGTLSAAAPLSSTAASDAWERAAVLPVLDRDERLLGVLRRSTLRRALAEAASAERDAGETTIAAVLARGCWDAFSGLAEAGLALLPRIAPVQPRKK